MQSFPIGSFLFWQIEKKVTERFRFFGFVRDYHQRNNPHCPPLAVRGKSRARSRARDLRSLARQEEEVDA